MLTFLPTCWDMEFYSVFLWVVLFSFMFFSPSPVLKVGLNMVTVNHSDWVNTCCYRFRYLLVSLLISETERELARPLLESSLCALHHCCDVCNVIATFLTFKFSGSREITALLVFVEQTTTMFLNFA